jgi:hypothetical protein
MPIRVTARHVRFLVQNTVVPMNRSSVRWFYRENGYKIEREALMPSERLDSRR